MHKGMEFVIRTIGFTGSRVITVVEFRIDAHPLDSDHDQ